MFFAKNIFKEELMKIIYKSSFKRINTLIARENILGTRIRKPQLIPKK